MESFEKKLLDAIDSDIRSNADLVTDLVEQETEDLRNNQITYFKAGLKKETDTYLEKELSDLRLYAATKSSTAKLDAKKKLLNKRKDLANELFEEVKNEVKKFIGSNDYKKYIEQNLKKVPISPNGYFLVRKEDEDLLKECLKSNNYLNEIKNAYLPLGGFRYVDEASRLEYSCDLNEKADEQFGWFRDNSGFQVKESGDIHE